MIPNEPRRAWAKFAHCCRDIPFSLGKSGGESAVLPSMCMRERAEKTRGSGEPSQCNWASERSETTWNSRLGELFAMAERIICHRLESGSIKTTRGGLLDIKIRGKR